VYFAAVVLGAEEARGKCRTSLTAILAARHSSESATLCGFSAISRMRFGDVSQIVHHDIVMAHHGNCHDDNRVPSVGVACCRRARPYT